MPVDNLTWVRARIEALRVLLDNPDPENPDWAIQYVTAAGALRDFWLESDEPLVRELTDEDWEWQSQCREFYSGYQAPTPLINNVQYEVGGIPALLVGDHDGISVQLAGDDHSYHWDWRGKELHPFIVAAVMERMLRYNVQPTDIPESFEQKD